MRERGIKRLPDGRWQYSWMYKGRYHRVIAPTRAIATANLAKVRASIAEGRYLEKEVGRETRFEDAVKRFLEWGQTNVAPRTAVRDRECAARWLAFPRFKGRTLAEISPADVEAYRAARLTSKGTHTEAGRRTYETAPVGKRTCDLELARLRRLFSLCITWKLARENPAKGVKLFHADNRHDRFLTHEEEGRVLDACPPDLRAAVVLSLHTGIRQGELLSLTWGQVDFTRRVITLTAGKTKSKKTRRVPLNALAKEAIETQPRGIAPGAPVFPTLAARDCFHLRYQFDRATEKAGVNKGATRETRVTWHTLRHTFASRLVQEGVSLQAVKELLGHSTMAMVMRYAHLADENLKSAVDALISPRKLQITCSGSGEGPEDARP